jgi:hypothetical protein
MQSNLAEPLVTRDLGAARIAYDKGGEEAAALSRDAHTIAVNGMAVEQHEQSGSQLKGIVFGGLDGILTSFAIIAGSVGANLSPVAMLALGVSNVLADALSMGAGEFLSSRSYNAYVTKEREREAWELQNYPAGEIAEMVELFVARGMSREDAEVVIQRMAKYKDFFVDLMMTEELSLPVPSDTGAMDAFKDGFTMFCAFAFFGMLPLIGFVLAGIFYPEVTSEGCVRRAARGRPWLPMAARGCPWLPVAARGCPWLPVAARGCPWLPVAAVTRGRRRRPLPCHDHLALALPLALPLPLRLSRSPARSPARCLALLPRR